MRFLTASLQSTTWRGLAILTLLFSLAVTASYFVTKVASAEEPEAAATRTWGQPGIYAFYDSRNLSPDQYPLVGGHIVFTWKMIEPQKGHYNWRVIDDWIEAQASLGKPAGLGINTYEGDCCGGDQAPNWLYQMHPDARAVCDGTSIPRYWHPEYKRHFADFIKAVAARYDDDPRIAWWETSVGIYGETSPAERAYRPCLEQKGLSSQVWVDFVNWNTDLFADSFKNTPLMLQYAPVHQNVRERKAFTDHAASRGVGFKHNGLRPDADALVIQHPTNPHYTLNGAGQYDPMITYRGQVPIGWETYDYLIPGEVGTYWGILTGLAAHADYMALGRDVTTEAPRRPILDFANEHLGRTLEDTPSVWTVLRKSEFSWYPWPGNYDFWLYQDDDAPGGRTAPEWNVSQHKEGRFTRRTDGASGNPYMYFNVDDGYIFGGANRVTVRVTYYDQGADTWELQYDAVTDPTRSAGVIQKTNTGAWKTAEFHLTDAHFANRQAGGNDFRIWNRGDGDVYIHLVQVIREAGETQTVTLQSGINGYTGATDTYINEWSRASNYGRSETVAVRSQEVMHGLLRFDLADILPAGANVTEAELEVFVRSRSNNNHMTVGVFQLNRAWAELEATWERARANNVWSTPGAAGVPGDRAGAPLATARFDATGDWYTFDVTDAARAWLHDPASNHGLLLRSTEASGAVQYSINSREWPDASRRPKLRITYQVGGPALPTPTPQPTWTPSPTPVGPTATPVPDATPTPPVDGDELEFKAGQGTFISRWEPANNFSGHTRLSVRNDDVMVTLLQFNNVSLPPDVVLERAILQVYQTGRSNNNLLQVGAFTVQRPWVADEATYNQARQGVAWEVPGVNGPSDRLSTPEDSRILETESGWVTLDITDAVQAWLANPSQNHGIALKSINASGNVQYDFASFQAHNLDVRPRLRLFFGEDSPPPVPTPVSPPSRPDKYLGAVYMPNGVNINADLSDWTDVAGVVLDRHTADYIHPRKIPEPWDNSGVLYAGWNEEWLFFAADVTDDVIVADSDEIWRDDSVEIGIDGEGTGVGGGDGHHQYTVAVDGRITDFGFAPAPDAQVAVRERPGGYIVEVAIPVDSLTISLFAGRTMGFTWGLHDDDTGGDWDSYMIWAGTSTISPQSEWGALELLPPGEAAPTPTPTSTAPGPTPTPTHTPSAAPATPTPTATPTWTPTPVPTETPASVTLQPGVAGYDGVRDTYLSAWEPNTNYGASTRLAVRSNDNMAGLMWFDLTSIPTGSAVSEARLELYVRSRSNSNWLDVHVHRMLRPWQEMQATWNQAQSGSNWGAPGANAVSDRDPASIATRRLDAAGVWVSFDITTAVQGWVNNPGSNHGLLFKSGNSSGNVQYDFAPREWDPIEQRPRLVVKYGSAATPTPTPTPQSVRFQPGVGGYVGVVDTYINQWEPNTNYATSSRVSVRNDDVMAGLFRFDVSAIQPGAQVVSAQVGLYVRSRTNANWLDVTGHALRRSWVAGQTTWNHASSGQSWSASGANGLGSDRDEVAFGSARLDREGQWVVWDVTDLVQAWVNNPGSNHGFIVKGGLASGNVQYDFAPSEWHVVEQRPYLDIVVHGHIDSDFPPPDPTATPQASPTPTFTPTPAASPTPTPAPQELVLQPGRDGYAGVADTYINQWAPDANYDGGTRLAVRSRHVMATLLRFELSQLPPAATILDAQLEVYVRSRTNSNWMDTEVFRVLRPWQQSQATWNRPVSGQTWGQPGAHGIGTDRDSNVVASARLDQDNVWVSYDITILVQDWVGSPEQNFGVVIRSGAQDSGQVQYDFAPAEWPHQNERPRLRIVYVP